MSLSDIAAITFDWGDTLATNHGQPYGHAQRRALEVLEDDLRACGGQPAVDWQARCHAELDAAWVSSAHPDHNPEHREFDMAAMVDGWLRASGCSSDDPAVVAAGRRWLDSTIELVLAYDGVTAALAALHERGLRLGILSHVAYPGTTCRAWFARRGWDRFFDFYSFSSDVGWIKPHPAHYQDAITQAGVGAEHILHVGDHPLRDVVGAREFGLRTCLRLTEGIYPAEQVATCRPDLAVIHVRELLDHLEA
ncbi:MAG: HAD family hydrolase [Planctomycetota bacterium]|jgi:putative hydrolase of the HAD superfamily